MNLLFTYLGLVWLRIIGDMTNNPEAFKDKNLANTLMSFNRTPRPGQGFLLQNNYEQEDLARRLIKKGKFGNAANNLVLTGTSGADQERAIENDIVGEKGEHSENKNESEKVANESNGDQAENKKENADRAENKMENADQPEDESMNATVANTEATEGHENDSSAVSEEDKDTTISTNKQETNEENVEEKEKVASVATQSDTKPNNDASEDNSEESKTQNQTASEAKSTQDSNIISQNSDSKTNNQVSDNNAVDINDQNAQNDQDSTITEDNRRLSINQENKSLFENVNSHYITDNLLNDKYNHKNAIHFDTTTKPQIKSTEQASIANKPVNPISSNSEKQPKPASDGKPKKKKKLIPISVKQTAVNAAKTGLQILFLISILLLMFVYTLVFFKYSMKQFYNEITFAIANGYSEFIEKQGIAKELPEARIKLFNTLKWIIFDVNDVHFADEVEQINDYQGMAYDFDVKNKEKINFILAANPPSTLKNLRFKKPIEYYYALSKDDAPYIYYEVEIQYIHDSTEVIIGFSDKTNLSEAKVGFPGQAPKSIGYNLKTGEVYIDGNIVFTFNFAREVRKSIGKDYIGKFDYNGCFFGIGFNLKNKMAFCTFNGRILNSLSYQTAAEIRYKIYKYKRNDMIEDDDTSNLKKVDKLNTLIKKLDLPKEYRDNIKDLPVFIPNGNHYVPVIYVTGASKFRVNIGGSVFQIKEKILDLGLLRKKN